MEDTRGCIRIKRSQHLMLFYLSPPYKNRRPHLFSKVAPLRIFTYELGGRESCGLLLSRAQGPDWAAGLAGVSGYNLCLPCPVTVLPLSPVSLRAVGSCIDSVELQPCLWQHFPLFFLLLVRLQGSEGCTKTQSNCLEGSS